MNAIEISNIKIIVMLETEFPSLQNSYYSNPFLEINVHYVLLNY